MSSAVVSAGFESKWRILVVGATGLMGRFIAEASLESGRPTFILVLPPVVDAGSAPVGGGLSKDKVVKALQDKGAIVLEGSITEKDRMVKILKENMIDAVICVVGGENILHQLTLIDAIKEVSTIKRFLPSEFGHDVDRANPVEPGIQMYMEKRAVRRAVEDVGSIPYTYICCNSIAAWPYHDTTHPTELTPPMDTFQIYGDGTVKAYFVAGSDIGKFTMKIVEDPRTVNKMVHFRPACNFMNVNELASIWEKKIGKTLPRVTFSEEQLLAAAAENHIPESIVASFTHDIFIKGCQFNFEIDGPNELEINQLYPDESYKTLEECFDEYGVVQLPTDFHPPPAPLAPPAAIDDDQDCGNFTADEMTVGPAESAILVPV